MWNKQWNNCWDWVLKRYNNTFDDVEIILKSKVTINRERMMEILVQLKDIIAKLTDEQPYEEVDVEADEQPDEQQDTKDMPDLESEESAAQRRNQQGQGLKIITPDQMLSRLPISLAQLESRNNSEKRKNEIR